LSLIGLFFVLLSGVALLRSQVQMLIVVGIAAVFQAAYAVNIGPATLTPGHMAVFFLGLAVIIRQKGIEASFRGLVYPLPGFFLLALTIWAVFSGLTMPRLFANEIQVIPLTAEGGQYVEIPLSPSAGNISQSFYFLVNLLIFGLTIAVVRTPRMLWNVVYGMLFVCLFNIGVAVVDSITYTIGAPDLLSFMRNADYGQAHSQAVAGMKRLTGSYPEPSEFAGATVGLFAFAFRLWRGGIRPQLSALASVALLVGVLLAFSTTGYVSLAVYLFIVYWANFFWIDRGFGNDVATKLRRYVVISFGPILALLFAIAVAIRPDLLNPIAAVFDDTIANKASSQSGIERTSWNLGGLRAFVESAGLGVGIGSMRLSSFVVALIATTGVVGVLLFSTFVYSVLRVTQRKNTLYPEVDQITAAARSGCFAFMLSASLAASTPDLGLLFFILAGMACAPTVHVRQYSSPPMQQPPNTAVATA